MKKLSFILPVYNVEEYVEKCIRSLVDKEFPYDDYEIIVVNDGSPDRSELIVTQLQDEIPNITLIHQENAGVSAARNKGLHIARGEYVVFIDPDDFVEIDLLNRLYSRVKRDDLDVLLVGRSSITSTGDIKKMLGFKDIEDQIFSGIDAFYLKDRVYRLYNSSVGFLYKKAFLLEYKIEYPLDVVYIEDGVFMRKIFAVASRVGFDNSNFYQIFLRPNSASRSNIPQSIKASKGFLKAADYLMDFKSEYELSKKAEELINGMITKFRLSPLMNSLNHKNLKSFYLSKDIIRGKGIIKLETENLPNKRIERYAKAFNFSPWLFALFYIIEKAKNKYSL